MLPNWRITYDGLLNMGNMRSIFKNFTLSHAYQCTYSVGSYSSFLNWAQAGGANRGFTLDELSGNPIPSSPYTSPDVSLTVPTSGLNGIPAYGLPSIKPVDGYEVPA